LRNFLKMNQLNDQNFQNQRAIIRVDFNVPLNEKLEVTDATRIVAAKPTIDYVLQQGGSCVLLSHLGRPKHQEPEFSLKNIVATVSEILGCEVLFSEHCVGPEAEALAQALQPGQVLLMENLRYHPEETKGDVDFAQQLAALGSIYINDAFGTAHRAHASTTIIAQFFEGKKCFGQLLKKEVDAIEKVMKNGASPVLAILGGAKISSKITIIESLLDKVDHLLIGGGMVYTFIKAQGGSIGNSICEDEYGDYALELMEKAAAKGVQLHLPEDVVAGDDFSDGANRKIFPVNAIEAGWEGMDAGPKSVLRFKELITTCRTILWNGPLGVFEFPSFAKGTIAVGEAIGEATRAGAFSLVGGGDSVAAVKQFGLETQMSYISTGGGAMLESLEGKILPGIAALDQ
jgi:phosphoglycerate kinase